MAAFSKGNVLTLSAMAEAATGLALLVAPAQVVMLLLGAELSGPSGYISRVAGIAMLSLGVACWSGLPAPDASVMAVRGMTVYNLLVAAYLGWLGAMVHVSGVLLWPAVVLHLVIGILLLRP